jgi:radical SAM protein with 4Fe4S-binding SPASM domain
MQRIKTNEVMSNECIDKSFDFIKKHFLSNRDSDGILNYNITGGEPLLHFDNIRRIVNYFSVFRNEYNITNLRFELSTNMFLMNKDYAEYLLENRCNFFIGFDGVEGAFKVNRGCGIQNEKDFYTVYNNIIKLYGLIKNDMKRITLNLVISPNNVKFLVESFSFLYSKFSGVSISLNIAYNEDWQQNDLSAFREQIMLLSNVYCKILLEEDRDFSIGLLDEHGKNAFARIPHGYVGCGGGEGMISIATDGDLYVCGNFIGCGIDKEKVKMGTIYDGIDHSLIKNFHEKLVAIDKNDCTLCQLYHRCYTHCPFVNYMDSGSIYKISNKQCELKKSLIYAADNIIDVLSKHDIDIIKDKFLSKYEGI